MLTKRIIPCLDCDLSVPEGRVVKGIKFKQIRYAGEPPELAKRYYEEGADEIVFLDITASHERRESMVDVIERTAEEVFMPLTVGGGIRTIDDIKKILRAGADKVSINTSAIKNPELIKEAAEKFGSQCIMVAIDAKRVKHHNIVKNFKHISGKHCITTSLRKIFNHRGYDLSEEMLFGLGSGLGFIYWKDNRMPFPFVGGRAGKIIEFEQNVCDALGIKMTAHKTTSVKKAYDELKKLIDNNELVMIYADIVYLPYFNILDIEGSHFGGHAIVVCGTCEENNTVYVSDLQEELHEVSLDDLKKARSSKHRPFPAENKWLVFEFDSKPSLKAETIINSIKKTADQLLNPPIRNIGIWGIEKFSEKILDWKTEIKGEFLGAACLNTYIYITEGGTGGGLFRFIYADFLKEIGELLGSKELLKIADNYETIGRNWDKIAVIFKEIHEKNDFTDENFSKISKELKEVAKMEKNAAFELKNFADNYTPDKIENIKINKVSKAKYGTADTQKDENTKYECSIYGGRKMTGVDAVKWAKKVEELGAGDIMLTSMDRDGTKEGFDLELTRTISEAVNIPVIASGGVGNPGHILDAFTIGKADAALAASIFHFNEYSIREVKKYLKDNGVDVRL